MRLNAIHRTITPRGLMSGSLLVAMLMITGCAGSGTSTSNGRAARSVSLGEFVQPTGSPNQAAAPQHTVEPRGVDPAIRDGAEPSADPRTGPDALRDPGPDPAMSRDETVSPPVAPTQPDGRPVLGAGDVPPRDWVQPSQLAAGDELIIDSFIGQIHGRPIFASEFFDPIHDQLRARSRQVPRAQFEQELARIVDERLTSLMQNYLVLADAEASLTAEQQQGLFYMLLERERNVISSQGGIRTAAERAASDDGFTGLGDMMRRQREELLQRNLQATKILPRVIVSWHDTERAYERRMRDQGVVRSVQLGRIWLDQNEDAALIEQVRARLTARDDFLQIASDIGAFEGGVLGSFPIHAGTVADAEGVPELYREYLTEVQQGETVGPFPQTLGSGRVRVVWLHVIRIVEPPSVYDRDVQRSIREDLFSQQFQKEIDRYFERVMEGTMDDREKMRTNLMRIARSRYLR